MYSYCEIPIIYVYELDDRLTEKQADGAWIVANSLFAFACQMYYSLAFDVFV